MEGMSKNKSEGNTTDIKKSLELSLKNSQKEGIEEPSLLHREQIVCFLWGKRQMGIPIDQVKETLAIRPLTRVFLTPPFVLGVVNVRGNILAVLDLAQLMGLNNLHFGGESKIVVVEAQGRKWGVLVDSMTGVRESPAEQLTPASTLLPQAPQWLRSVLTGQDSTIGILDMNLLLETEALQKLIGKKETSSISG